ncbi:MAG: PadR family transcriptional regulator [Candidatus Izemoplasma sp.]|nr:PadR family transcriptional regulator [Candidatus Izemoplasma sp.]
MGDNTLDNLIQELRKGTLVLAVCSQLSTQHYGYSLVDTLQKKGLDIDKNTLYPLLRRLEKQDILTATWDTKRARPRKYYQLSTYGKKIYASLKDEYHALHKVIKQLMGE